MATHRCRLQLLLLLLLFIPGNLSEYVRVFRILEGVPAGTRIGYIGEAEVRYLQDMNIEMKMLMVILLWMSIKMMWRRERVCGRLGMISIPKMEIIGRIMKPVRRSDLLLMSDMWMMMTDIVMPMMMMVSNT